MEWQLDLRQEKWKNKTMIRINLIKAEKAALPPKKFEEKGKKPVPTPLIILLIFIATAAYFIIQRNAIKNERSLLEVSQAEKAKYRDIEAKLDQINKQKEIVVKKIDLINKLKSHQGVPVTILDELSKHIPYWVWLTEASYDKQIIQIKGRAISNNLIADYIYNLEQSSYFNNVNLISSTQRTVRNNQFYNFALTASYVFPPVPQPSQEKNIKEAKK